MKSTFRGLMVASIAVVVLGSNGCSKKSDSTPNPELGTPPTYKSERSAEGKGSALDKNTKKK